MPESEKSRLAVLKAGKANFRVLPFPGLEAKVGMVVLSLNESQAAVIAADLYLAGEGLKFTEFTSEVYADEVNTQLLFRLLREPDNQDKPFAATVEEVRTSITRAEKNALITEYNEFERDCSPKLADLSDQQLDELVDEVKKNPETLSYLDTSTLKRLITFLADRPVKSRKASGPTS